MRKVLLALCIFPAGLAFPQEQPAPEPPLPPLDYIIGRVAQKTQDDLALRRDLFSYTKFTLVEDLEHPEDQRVIQREESIVYGKDGKSYQKKIRKNNVLVRNPKEEEVKFEIDETIIHRYTFAFAITPRETVNGRPCFALTFTPKGNFPEKTEQEWALNRSSGIMYVDMEDFFVVRFSGHLTQEHRKGIIGKVHNCEITLEQIKFGVISVPYSVVVLFRYSIVGVESSLRRTTLYSNYELVQKSQLPSPQ